MTGAEFRAAREAIGWTGRELARRLECSPDYVGQLERGRRPIPAPVAAWVQQVSEFHARHPAPDWRARAAE